MNLSDIRKQVKNITDYSPELASFNTKLDEIINNSYYSIWTAKHWNFTTKEMFFTFHPDIRPDRDTANGTPNASVTKGDRRVTFSTGIDRLTNIWEGQPIAIQGREYIISKVISPSVILLTEPFTGASSVDEMEWVIKMRWYTLPSDAVSLYFIGMRQYPINNNNTNKYTQLQAYREEQIGLDADVYADDAQAYIMGSSKVIPAGETLDLTNVPVVVGTPFPLNSYIEVCWCFEKDGLYGALSEPKVHQFTDNDNLGLDVAFQSWDKQPIVADTYQAKDRKPTQYEGYRKVIFWNANFDRSTGERLGIPKWKHFTIAGAIRNTEQFLNVIVADDTAPNISVTDFSSIDPGNEEYVEIDGVHKTFRTYPRVDGWDAYIAKLPAGVFPEVQEQFFKKGVIRYVRKPKPLSMSTDTPEMPYDFHQLIVYKALEDIYLKLGSATMSKIYEDKIRREIKDLADQYLVQDDVSYRRGQFQNTTRMFAPWALTEVI